MTSLAYLIRAAAILVAPPRPPLPIGDTSKRREPWLDRWSFKNADGRRVWAWVEVSGQPPIDVRTWIEEWLPGPVRCEECRIRVEVEDGEGATTFAHGEPEVEIRDADLRIEHSDGGGGYSYVPVEVIAELLRRAGWEVKAPK